jgi:molecular chaperone HscB
MLDFSRNHFDLFGLPPRFRLDAAALEDAWRRLQSDVHPDRHAAGSDADRRAALQASARVNEAYRTLREPVGRAEYLLALHGIDAARETDTALPMTFLERQLERREEAADAAAARDAAALRAVLDEVRREATALETSLAAQIDDAGDHAGARMRVRELRFLHKVAEDLAVMEQALDEPVDG